MSKPTDEQPRKSPTREGDITAQKIRLARGNPSQDDELEVFEVPVDEQPWALNAMYCCLLAVPSQVIIVFLVPFSTHESAVEGDPNIENMTGHEGLEPVGLRLTSLSLALALRRWAPSCSR